MKEKMERIVKGPFALDSTSMQRVGGPVSPPEMIVLAKYARMFFEAPTCDRAKILSETVQILQGTWSRWNCRTVRLWFNNHEEEVKSGDFETAMSPDENGLTSVSSVTNSAEVFPETDKVHVEKELESDALARHQENFVPEEPNNEEQNCATSEELSSGLCPEDQQPEVTLHQSTEEITNLQDPEPASTSEGAITAKADASDEPVPKATTDSESNGTDLPQARRPLRRAKFLQALGSPGYAGYNGNVPFCQPAFVPQTVPVAQQGFPIMAPMVPVQAPILTGGAMIVLQPIPCQNLVQFGCANVNVYLTNLAPQLRPQNIRTPALL